MDIERLEKIIQCAKEALAERRRLERLTENYVSKTNSAGFSRARTTTFNASTSHAAERARSFESDLKRLILGEEAGTSDPAKGTGDVAK